MNQMIGYVAGDPPYFYDNGEQIAVVFRTDADVVRSVLPPVLKLPEGPARAIVRVVNPTRSTFGPYLGVYLAVPALLDGEPVLHGLTGMKTSFSGVIGGRDSWGMPLQVGQITKEWDGDAVNVVAGRNGVEFVRLSTRLDTPTEKPEGWGRLTYATRRQLFEKDSTENLLITVKSTHEGHEVVRHWKATSVLKLVGGQPGDDWSMFPVHEVLETRYASAGGMNTLHRGTILAEW